MTKLIILTASIIRGDFHKKTIGKFYEFFYEYLKEYDIYHIINIDEPTKLKLFFNRHETMHVYNEIIPEQVNTIFINEPNPGFLQAYKKLVSKVEELDLVNDDYLYYWLEDDWEPKSNYNIQQFFTLLKYSNTSYTFSNNAPLGSFRGGPFMTGTYFKNVFNIKQYMNDTCDPEKQTQRWVRGGNNKNGHSFIHRLSITNETIDNADIHLIMICPVSKIETSDLCNWIYKSPPYDSSISFQFHLITYNEHFELQYSIVKADNYDLKSITQTELDLIFNNLSIKHFVIKPIIMFDLGRQFNDKYNLKKWAKITDGTSYSSIDFYNAQLGNWRLLNIDNLRLKPEITMNKGFFSAFGYIHQCLPYLENEYFNKGIFLNIMYYSHNYGNYPNFQVIGDILQLNYKPSINKENKQFTELNCFAGLCKQICGRQQKDEDTSQYKSFKNDFTKANKYLFKYFKFHPSITEYVDLFTKQFNNKKVFGIHYRGTDKNKVNWVTHISIEEFMLIIEYHLKHNYYDIIFISTDDFQFIIKMKECYDAYYTILFYDEEKNSDNNQSIHLNRLTVMENKTREINHCKDDIDRLVTIEHELKLETQYNRILFENVVVNSFLLSKCDLVLKTHSQVSAYSKVFNPELEIYRVNACQEGYWPDSHIPLYEYQNIDDTKVKNILEKKLKNEFNIEKKNKYKDI
jgi:hypothetical protein